MALIKRIIKYIIGRSLKYLVIPIFTYFWKLNKQDDIFILCDRWNEARDNAFALFQYLLKNYPDKPIFYIFDTNDKNIDYQKLQPYKDNVLSYRSIKFWTYLNSAKYIASSHVDIMHVCSGYLGNWDKKTTCFLQHGITMNDLGHYYRDGIAKFNIICSGSKVEFEFLQKKSTSLKVKPIYTGLARWDRFRKNGNNNGTKTILVMPTWRKNLILPVDGAIKNLTYRIEHLKTTKYFLAWQEFIDSAELAQLLEQHNINVIFYPHPSIYTILGTRVFTSTNPAVKIADPRVDDLSQIIEDSCLYITDYSSAFWEFAYKQQPSILYQFDQDDFKKNQWKEGYFDYKKDSFGLVVDNIESLLHELKNCINRDFILDDIYKEKIDQHFILFDNKNSERIYNAILNFKNK